MYAAWLRTTLILLLAGCANPPCNVWVARALRAAGIEVRSSLTTEGLLAQLRPLSSR
jgi:lipoprotein NlpI